MPMKLRSPLKKWVQKQLDLELLVGQSALTLRNTQAKDGPQPTSNTANGRYLSAPNDRDDRTYYIRRREYWYPQEVTQRNSIHRDHQRRKSERTIYEEDRAAREEAIARQDRAIVRQEESRRDQENLLAEQLEAKARQRVAEDKIHQIDLARARRVRGQNQHFWAEQQQLQPRESDVSTANRSLKTLQSGRGRNDRGSWSSESDSAPDHVFFTSQRFEYGQTDLADPRLQSNKNHRSTEVRRMISPGHKPRSFPVFRDHVDHDAPQYPRRAHDRQRSRKSNSQDDLADSITGKSRSAEVPAAKVWGKGEALSTKKPAVPPLNLKTKPRGADQFGVKVERCQPIDQVGLLSKEISERIVLDDPDIGKTKRSSGDQSKRHQNGEHGRIDREKVVRATESRPTDIPLSMSSNAKAFGKPENSNRKPQMREHNQQKGSIGIHRPPSINIAPSAMASQLTTPTQERPANSFIPSKRPSAKSPNFSTSSSTDDCLTSQQLPISGNVNDWLSVPKMSRKVQFTEPAGSTQREDAVIGPQTRSRNIDHPSIEKSGAPRPSKVPPKIPPRPAAILKPMPQKKLLKYDPVRDSAATWTPPKIDRSFRNIDTANDGSLSQHPTSAMTAECRQGPAFGTLPASSNSIAKPKFSDRTSDIEGTRRSQSTSFRNRWQNSAVPSLEHYAEQRIWQDA